MKERVNKLREESINIHPYISIERAKIVTDTYKKYAGTFSVPVLRALTFQNLMENKAVAIGEGELIVGERGSYPLATPTFPELCCHSLKDFELINNREKISFKVNDEVRKIQEKEIIPYWENRSMRRRIFKNVDSEWKDCYEAGMFTEFMEQRAPGHTVADGKMYKKGFAGFIKDIEKSMEKIDYLNDLHAYDKREQLKAMLICAKALITFAHRYADKAQELAATEKDTARKEELLKIAGVCRHVPENPPRNFWEALQMYWFVHLGVVTELNTWDSFNPGRLDQHMNPFYVKELEEGTMTREEAKEVLECFWIKFNNQPAPPKVGVTLAESGTYTDFANINQGGLKEDGSDGVNEFTYLVLEVIDEMRLLQPSTNIQLSEKSPDKFLKKALHIIKKGWGQPSVFNADQVIKEMLRQGKSLEDARNGGTSGCVETGAFGKESYILTGYFNLVKVLEITLNNGIDPQTSKKLGIETGDPINFKSFEELIEAFKKQLHHFINIKISGSHIIEKLYAEYMPSPFLSITVDDCIEKAQDYNAGGARYHSRYIQGVGIGSISDSLSSIKHHVFERKEINMKEILEALKDNFKNQEILHQIFLNKTPKYGNDNDMADDIMKIVFNVFFEEVDGRKSVTGGVYRIDMLPTTCHIYFGSVIGATPDGRKAGEPLSEGISPVQGVDRFGPTAVIKSASKMEQVKTGGTLLNQKFTPQLLKGEEGINSLGYLIRTYFKLGGHHIQFNVVDAATLRAAQKEPEKYGDLIVRVAGYSDYFNNLNENLQNEIISRTEHMAI